MKKNVLLLAVIVLAATGLYFYSKQTSKINGVLLLSENTGDISGYYKWEKELENRNLRAIVKPEREVLEKYPDYFKKLAAKGHEIATGYGKDPFWNMPYEEQFRIMKEYKESAEKIIGKPIRIFSSKYFAYDENTLKAADALGISYVLARGEGIKAVIYSPNEYKVKLLSVSNLVFEDMGSGSLCDASLFQRGSTAEDFRQILDQSFSEKPQDLVLVSHVYIGGTRTGWWEAYQSALDSKKVAWLSFDSWVAKANELKMPYAQIPYNTEVKYTVPKPAVPLDQIELIPELKSENGLIVFHNGRGPMCLDFLEFIKDIDFPVEQHLEGEESFGANLADYKQKFSQSKGLSSNFGYYPIIFINNKAYSGFNAQIKTELIKQIEEVQE